MHINKLIPLFIIELLIITIALLILFYLGQLISASWPLLALGLTLYIVWHTYHIFKLIEWLASKQCPHLFASFGIWKEICTQLTNLQKDSQSGQRRLAKYLDNYRTFADKMPDPVIIINMRSGESEGDIEWFNKSAQIKFHLKKKKHIGSNIKKIFTDPVFKDFISSIKIKKNLQINSPLDSNKVLSLRMIPYQKTSRLLLFSDVSRIYWSDKMRKDFIANVSHELRTPLTVISGYLESFEAHFEENETFLKPVQTMQQQSLRMNNLVQDLLVLSKLESETGTDRSKPLLPVPVIIESVINDAKILNSEKNYQIKTDIDSSLMMHGYENEIQSMISNLINNAIRYTPDGSVIQINWSRNNNKKLVFSVKDNGDGIEEKHLQRLTERFYRVDKGRSRSEGGTGLGLSIVKHIINHHHGKLKIKSKVGEGSQFICSFDR